VARERSAPTVVFDTNVLVAELAFPEEPPVCVAVAEAGAVEVAVSPALLREFAGVLDYDHLPLSAERRAGAVERVVAFARVVEPAVSVDAADDPDDDAVLECALAAGADGVISDDAHLRALDEVVGLDVLTRDEFLDCDADREM
jgi:putative PIN family toxin of toxin-antitoxin system